MLGSVILGSRELAWKCGNEAKKKVCTECVLVSKVMVQSHKQISLAHSDIFIYESSVITSFCDLHLLCIKNSVKDY